MPHLMVSYTQRLEIQVVSWNWPSASSPKMSCTGHRSDRSTFKQNQTINFPLSGNLLSALIFWDVFPLQGISSFCYNFLQLVTKATWITAEYTVFVFWKKPPGTMSWFPFMDFKLRESRKLTIIWSDLLPSTSHWIAPCDWPRKGPSKSTDSESHVSKHVNYWHCHSHH